MNNQKLSFHGTAAKLFSLQLINVILVIVTLGIYYPWARAASMKYLYGETEFALYRFSFLGTGWEMFKGLVLGMLILSISYGTFFYLATAHHPFIGSFLSLFFLILFIPYVIHSSLRFRTSRTSWRGVLFSYNGDLKELMNLVAKGVFLSILTLGIYGAWFSVELRRYIWGHTQFGNVRFGFKGKGAAYLKMFLVGYLLTLVTFGIYFFWWAKNLFNYYVNNLYMEQDKKEIRFKASATGADLFKLYTGNILLIIFTLGLGTPWATVRTIRFVFQNTELLGELDVEQISTGESVHASAIGDSLADTLDVGIV